MLIAPLLHSARSTLRCSLILRTCRNDARLATLPPRLVLKYALALSSSAIEQVIRRAAVPVHQLAVYNASHHRQQDTPVVLAGLTKLRIKDHDAKNVLNSPVEVLDLAIGLVRKGCDKVLMHLGSFKQLAH